MTETPVALLHALAATPDMWSAQHAALTAAGHPVLTPWLPDSATVLAPPTLDALADQVARELDRRGMGQVVLVGCSMGGYLAGAFLRAHPGRAAALVLVSTRGRADDDAEAAGRRVFAGRFTDPAHTAAMTDATVPRLVGATTRRHRPGVCQRVRQMAEEVPPRNVAWAQRALADRRDAEDVLAAFTGPAEVLAGDEDELIPATEAGRLAAVLPSAGLRVVPGAGHLLPVEAPESVTEAITDVLARVRVPAEGAR